MKIGVIIPTRGDRPEFLENCLRMLNAQTLQPHIVELIDFEPGEQCDITKRYRIGYDRLRNKGLDGIAFIEDDDWYRPDYLEIMTTEWMKRGCPDLFGTMYTIYYHLRLKAWFEFQHDRRASAMNTLIKPDLNFEWCPDHEAYTDLHLWKIALNGMTFRPKQVIAMGIKHGIGMCGGRNHTDRLNRFVNHDKELRFMKSVMDAESFEFYSKFEFKLTI